MRRAARVALTVVLTGVAVSACGRPDESTPAGRANARPGWPTELVLAMGINPEDESLMARVSPLVRRIEQATGLPVRFFRSSSYTAVVEAMRARRVDAMQTGVFSYLLAEKEAGAEALAVYVTARGPVFDPTLKPDYHGIIVVKKGSGIETLADLRGRTFNYGDPAGTSDHLVPKSELIAAGFNPDRDLRTRFAGDHSSALLSLWNGTADAAATADSAMRYLAAGLKIAYCDFPPDRIGRPHTQAELRAVFDACPNGHIAAIHSAAIPGTPFAVRADLPAGLKATIRDALLSTPEDPEFIRQGKVWYIDPSAEMGLRDIFAYFDHMRAMAKHLDLDLRGPR